MQFWDWRSGYCFQKLQSLAQPGSLDSESGIFASSFDMSGCRLITGEADKTIKIYKEDETAVRDRERKDVETNFCFFIYRLKRHTQLNGNRKFYERKDSNLKTLYFSLIQLHCNYNH